MPFSRCCGTTEEEQSSRSRSSSSSMDDCIFCLISNGEDEYTELNDDMVCFRDIYPAAPHHFLVIPRKHIKSCSSLTKKDAPLVQQMADMGRAALQDQGCLQMIGFHQPPYISVDHLHLHVLAPASRIDDDMLYKFIRRTNRFISVSVVLAAIKKGEKIISC
uniref:Histidine triad nucleotide-binding protein 3-like n=1 Tax=Gadus morhua TaxID=8049 RepID=A0A8C5FX00_GADMO